MTTRWVVHAERVDRVDGTFLMTRMANEVAADARILVPVDKGKLREGIEIAYVSGDFARITFERPGGGGGVGGNQAQYVEEVPYFVEFGTRHSRAQPYIRPAVYKKR